MARDPNITFATKKIGINEEPDVNNTTDSLLAWNPDTGAIDQVSKASLVPGGSADLQTVTDAGATTDNEIVSNIPDGVEQQSYVSNSQFGQAYVGVHDEKPAFVALGNGNAAAILAAGSVAITNNDNVTGVYSVNAEGEPTFNGEVFGGGGGSQDLQDTLDNGSTANIAGQVSVTANAGFLFQAGASGQMEISPANGVVLNGNGKGVGIYGSSDGAIIDGQGGDVQIKGGGANGIVVTPNNGFKYSIDDSANYTDRSIPDVAYVNSLVSPNQNLQQTLDNGSEASIQTPFVVEQNTGADQTIISGQNGEMIVYGSQAVTLQSPNSLGMYNQAGNGELTITNNGVNIDANTNGKVMVGATDGGIKYKGDYSADYTERSLPDVGYVDNKFVPYIGADQNVDLGNNNIDANSIGLVDQVDGEDLHRITAGEERFTFKKDGSNPYFSIQPTGIVTYDANGNVQRVYSFATGIGNNTLPATFTINGGNAIEAEEDGNVNLVIPSTDLKSRSKILYADVTDSATITGTTAETILKTYIIPANSVTTGYISIQAFFDKIGTNGAGVFRFHKNTAPNLTGSTQIARINPSNAQLTLPLSRNYLLKPNGTLYGYTFSGATPTEIASTVAADTVVFNPTVDNYFMLTGQVVSTADSFKVSGCEILYKQSQ